MSFPQAGQGALRSLAGCFGFSGDDVEKPCRVLSGGEKARLVMAKMLFDPPNFLVLDEPTNHLDMATKEMLVAALSEFEGTMLFVSHDRHFLAALSNRVLELTPDGVHQFRRRLHRICGTDGPGGARPEELTSWRQQGHDLVHERAGARQRLNACACKLPQFGDIDRVRRASIEQFAEQPFPQFGGQGLNLVVGQDQPAQQGRQRLAGNFAQPGAAKTDLAQRHAIAERSRKPFEAVAGAEQDAQLVKAPHVFRKRGQRAAAKIEKFERVGESENLAREFAQPMKPQFARPGEIATTKGLQFLNGRAWHGLALADCRDKKKPSKSGRVRTRAVSSFHRSTGHGKRLALVGIEAIGGF